MVDLSIIIVSYNTRELLGETLESVFSAFTHSGHLTHEVIVVDNGSTDDSQTLVASLQKRYANLVLIQNKNNLGFSKANNIGVAKSSGTYILFLNSDTIVSALRAAKLIEYFEQKHTIGALTVKVVLPDGTIDPACHRGFPTVWRAFSYMSGLEHVTSPLPGFNRLFGGYHLTHLAHDTIHEVDAISGAFFLMKKALFIELGGFDESFFMYGEDIDLAYRIKKAGYKVIYFPEQTITHIKGQSGMKKNNPQQKKQTSIHFYSAMKIFYAKHYLRRYPFVINKLVLWAIEKKKAQINTT